MFDRVLNTSVTDDQQFQSFFLFYASNKGRILKNINHGITQRTGYISFTWNLIILLFCLHTGNVIDIQTGNWVGKMSGLGAGVDSFYEYLLKVCFFLSAITYFFTYFKLCIFRKTATLSFSLACWKEINRNHYSNSANICSNLAVETLEKDTKYLKLTVKKPERRH